MVVMVIYTVTTTAELPVYATRVSMLWSVLRPTHLVTVAVFGFSGGVKGHCLSSLAGYRVWSGEWAFLTAHATLAVSVCVCVRPCCDVCVCVGCGLGGALLC